MGAEGRETFSRGSARGRWGNPPAYSPGIHYSAKRAAEFTDGPVRPLSELCRSSDTFFNPVIALHDVDAELHAARSLLTSRLFRGIRATLGCRKRIRLRYRNDCERRGDCYCHDAYQIFHRYLLLA